MNHLLNNTFGLPTEIDEAEVVFAGAKEDPPMAANLPPISGAIYWSNDIEKDLNLTLTVRHVYRDGRSFRNKNISLIFFSEFSQGFASHKAR